MMDCKKALQEADGDFDKAIEILRKKGQKIMGKRQDREATEGSVFVFTADDASEGMIVALSSETDFVAKNEEFQKLGQAILDTAVAEKPADVAALKALPLEGRPIEEHITDLVGKIGEKIELTVYQHLAGDKVVSYKHGEKIGVLVALSGGADSYEEVGRNVAMQAAAMRPLALNEDGVDPAIIEKEMEIGRDQAKQEGKPENIIDRIAQGKVKKFLQENTLLNQKYVKNDKQSVQQYVREAGLEIAGYARVEIGA